MDQRFFEKVFIVVKCDFNTEMKIQLKKYTLKTGLIIVY